MADASRSGNGVKGGNAKLRLGFPIVGSLGAPGKPGRAGKPAPAHLSPQARVVNETALKSEHPLYPHESFLPTQRSICYGIQP
jgi:hypothetical protein